MDSKENHWFTGQGSEMLEELGIKAGSRIVDFGSGKGRYTVPLSQAVGDRGHVYSIERDAGEVQTLNERLEAFGNVGAVYIYPAALPHPGAVDMTKVAAVMDKTGFDHKGDRVFHMMHNKDRVDDRVNTFALRNE